MQRGTTRTGLNWDGDYDDDNDNDQERRKGWAGSGTRDGGYSLESEEGWFRLGENQVALGRMLV